MYQNRPGSFSCPHTHHQLLFFKRFKIFNEDLVAVEIKRVTIELNPPAYLGAQILDISKNLMTTFHYEVMKQKYGINTENTIIYYILYTLTILPKTNTKKQHS
jgi:hypothetical protein